MNMKIPKSTLITALALYIGSAIAAYVTFATLGDSLPVPGRNAGGGNQEDVAEEQLVGTLLTIDPSEPKDQVCPLNGAYYTAAEREAWEKHRPLAVMIENSPDARPQSGLSQADIVFEAVAEGGVTRFMGMFLCDVQVSDTTLAPVRSARVYFIDYASGFNYPLYTHVGGANVPGRTDALGRLSDYGWVGRNNLNQFSIGYPTFVRDYNRLEGRQIATEHTMVTTTESLWDVADEREWTNITPEFRVGRTLVEEADWQENFEPWSFQAEQGPAGEITEVSYDFWSGYNEYAVRWELDPETGMYKRFQGGEAHIDLNNEQQVMAANVVVLQTTEEGPINEKKHMYYQTTGRGDAFIFQNGELIEARWSKPTRESELQFLDATGNPVEMARGLTWISVVNELTTPEY